MRSAERTSIGMQTDAGAANAGGRANAHRGASAALVSAAGVEASFLNVCERAGRSTNGCAVAASTTRCLWSESATTAAAAAVGAERGRVRGGGSCDYCGRVEGTLTCVRWSASNCCGVHVCAAVCLTDERAR